MRVTGPLLRLLRLFDDRSPDWLYGLEIIRQTGLKSGTIYPLLDRLEGEGWVRSKWQGSEVPTPGPRRKYYTLTGLGAHEARQLLLEHGIVQGLAWR